MPLLTDPLKKKQEFFAINGLRFFAASWLLLFHATSKFGQLDCLQAIQPILTQGTLAMTLFFMLSGFVLSYRYVQFSTPEDTHQYVAARIARIYPIYLFIGVTTLWSIGDNASDFFLIFQFGSPGVIIFKLFAVFLFLFVIQAWFPGLFNIWNFGGTWSISVEAFFYALFPTLRQKIGNLGNRSLAVVTCVLPAIMVVITVGALDSLSRMNNAIIIFYVLPVFRLPEFLFGICGYVLFIERRFCRKSLAISGGVSLILLLAGIYWHDFPGYVEWDPFAAVTFMAAFVFCLQANAPNLVKRCINYLGRISYCVYMAQFTTIPILEKYKDSFTIEQDWILLISSTLIMAILAYHFVEVLAYSKVNALTVRVSRKIRSFFQIDILPNKSVDSTVTSVMISAPSEARKQ